MTGVSAATIRATGLWSSVSPIFEWDGSLRDVIIFNCTPDDWYVLFHSLEKKEGVTILYPTSGADFWSDPSSIFSHFQGKSIFIKSNSLEFKCDIVSPELIEFDFDPRQVTDQATFDHLVSFMRHMSSVTEKSIFLTDEGEHETALIAVQPTAAS